MRYIAFLIFILLSSISDAQIISPFKNDGEMISYRKLSETFKVKGEYVDGDYYILVTAEWCRPCGELKKQLEEKGYFGHKIAKVDLDEEGELASKLISPRRTIPQLIRYRITENGKKVVKSFRDSESLEEFFK